MFISESLHYIGNEQKEVKFKKKKNMEFSIRGGGGAFRFGLRFHNFFFYFFKHGLNH